MHECVIFVLEAIFMYAKFLNNGMNKPYRFEQNIGMSKSPAVICKN